MMQDMRTLSMTMKGQIYIPEDWQQKMRLKKPGKVQAWFDEKNEIITVKMVPDFFDLVGKLKRPPELAHLTPEELIDSYYENYAPEEGGLA